MRRADMGTPTSIHCPRCNSRQAQRHPLVILTNDGVQPSGWELHTCRACGFLGKAPTTRKEAAA